MIIVASLLRTKLAKGKEVVEVEDLRGRTSTHHHQAADPGRVVLVDHLPAAAHGHHRTLTTSMDSAQRCHQTPPTLVWNTSAASWTTRSASSPTGLTRTAAPGSPPPPVPGCAPVEASCTLLFSFTRSASVLTCRRQSLRGPATRLSATPSAKRTEAKCVEALGG